MLILSRKMHEEIVIGDNIRVQVLEVRGGRVKLGFTAPPTVRICREEIHHPFDQDDNPHEAFAGAVFASECCPTI